MTKPIDSQPSAFAMKAVTAILLGFTKHGYTTPEMIRLCAMLLDEHIAMEVKARQDLDKQLRAEVAEWERACCGCGTCNDMEKH